MAAKRQQRQHSVNIGSYYTYGNVAHELQPSYPSYPAQEQEEKQRREEAARAAKAEAKEHRVFTVKMIGAILVLFFGSIAFMGMHVKVENLERTMRQQKSELADLKSSNAILEAELTEQLDMDYIKQEATERLGMSEPQPYQIVYIDVPKQSYTIQYAADDMKAEESMLSKVSNIWKKD